jgi:hypothetical protein
MKLKPKVWTFKDGVWSTPSFGASLMKANAKCPKCLGRLDDLNGFFYNHNDENTTPATFTREHQCGVKLRLFIGDGT